MNASLSLPGSSRLRKLLAPIAGPRAAVSASAPRPGGVAFTRKLVMCAVAAAAGLGGSGVAATVAAAEEPWGYEVVTPQGKGGGAVTRVDSFQAARDGRKLLYTTIGSFDSFPTASIPFYTRYLGTRGATGWDTTAVDPPVSSAIDIDQTLQTTLAASSNLRYTVVASPNALVSGAVRDGANLYLLDTQTKMYTLIYGVPNSSEFRRLAENGGAMNVQHLSDDGKTVIFRTPETITPDWDREGMNLYRWREGQPLQVLNVLPDGSRVNAGLSIYRNEEFGFGASPGDLNTDRLYFESDAGSSIPTGVYLRENGTTTRPISYSRATGADPARPVLAAGLLGQSADGRYAFIVKNGMTPLTDETPAPDPNGSVSQIVYRYDALDDSLEFVAYADQVNPLAWSRDGRTLVYVTRVEFYFSRTEVWRDGALTQLTPVIDPFAQAGATVILVSENGKFITYRSADPVEADFHGIDNVSECGERYCSVTYLHDADARTTVCASCAEGSTSATRSGGDPSIALTKSVMGSNVPRTTLDDGTVFFTTRAGLVAEDTNNEYDVYAYRSGRQRLITPAFHGVEYTRFLDATPDGSTVFVATDARLEPRDRDSVTDVYAMRNGGGFPYDSGAVAVPCAGSACRVGGPSAAKTPTVGSRDFDGAGNVEEPGPRSPRKPAPVRLSVVGSRSVGSAGKRVQVRVSGRGRISVSGSSVRNRTVAVRRAGVHAVGVRLNDRAKRRLAQGTIVRADVRIVYRAINGVRRTESVMLVFKASSTKTRGR